MKEYPFVYISPHSMPDATRAVIVLPEIYGLNRFIKSVADRAAQELHAIGLGLDHFFAANGKKNVVEYSEYDKGASLMSQVTGEAYLELFRQALDGIERTYPAITQVVVLGFWFGGKLAYLSGVDERVNTIVSFYGGASLAPDFYQGKSAVQALAEARTNDRNLRVIGLFGEKDELITVEDREGIRDALSEVHITCEIATFAAGHAFFNQDRSDRYDQAAAQEAWRCAKDFLARP